MHVDIGNPSLSWALSSGWPSLNSPRNPKPRDPEPPNIKGAKKNLWQSVMGSWVRGQQTIAPSFFAGCFLVTSWLNWQLELYPWHSVVWSPSVLSPLHCGWSSIGKGSIFFSCLPYRLHGPWNSHLSLSTLFVNALQKETFREGISCFFFLQTLLSLPLIVLSPAFMSRSPTSLYTPLLSTCWHHQERIVSREEEFSPSAAILLYSAPYGLRGELLPGMASLFSDWCQRNLAAVVQAANTRAGGKMYTIHNAHLTHGLPD